MSHIIYRFKTSLPFRAAVWGGILFLVTGSAVSARTIAFAGREWTVRTGNGGPGPNNWSDSAESVWVDGGGLHLKIRRIDNEWHCAEVTSTQPTQHGMHRFYIAGRIDLLDKNIVASPFLYKDDSHEVDIEFSKWKRSSDKAGQYVVQPYSTPANIHRFEINLNGNFSTHYFNWLSDSICFKSFHGHYPEPPSGTLIQDWTYTGGNNPSESDDMRIHINFWLINGAAPSDGQEAEFIVKDADLPSPPKVQTLKTPDNVATNVSPER